MILKAAYNISNEQIPLNLLNMLSVVYVESKFLDFQ